MAYIDTYNLRQSSDMKARTEVAIAKAAQDVLNEDGGTTNHTNRVTWAQWALKNSTVAAEQMLWGLVGNATIQTNGEASTDSEIQFTINGLVDQFSDGSQS